jgi:hypothetical protein
MRARRPCHQCPAVCLQQPGQQPAQRLSASPCAVAAAACRISAGCTAGHTAASAQHCRPQQPALPAAALPPAIEVSRYACCRGRTMTRLTQTDGCNSRPGCCRFLPSCQVMAAQPAAAHNVLHSHIARCAWSPCSSHALRSCGCRTPCSKSCPGCVARRSVLTVAATRQRGHQKPLFHQPASSVLEVCNRHGIQITEVLEKTQHSLLWECAGHGLRQGLPGSCVACAAAGPAVAAAPAAAAGAMLLPWLLLLRAQLPPRKLPPTPLLLLLPALDCWPLLSTSWPYQCGTSCDDPQQLC